MFLQEFHRLAQSVGRKQFLRRLAKQCLYLGEECRPAHAQFKGYGGHVEVLLIKVLVHKGVHVLQEIPVIRREGFLLREVCDCRLGQRVLQKPAVGDYVLHNREKVS